MITKTKNCVYILLTTIAFIFVSCNNERDENMVDNSKSIKSEIITSSKVLAEIDNTLIKSFITDQLALVGAATFKSRIAVDSHLFTKFINQNGLITYSLQINDYSRKTPYFRYLIITKKGIIEKAGFSKIIPEFPTITFNEKNFTGIIQVLDYEGNVYAQTNFKDGHVLEEKSKNTVLSIVCNEFVEIIVHNCTNGGNHAPGTSCSGGAVNDGYYEIRTSYYCVARDHLSITPPDAINGESGGGGHPQLTHFIINLNNEQRNWIYNVATPTEKDKIFYFLDDSGFSNFSKEFVKQFITQTIENPNLNLDFDASAKSPANIDLLAVSGGTVEERNFQECFTALTTSPLFQQLFFNTFTEGNRYNAEFKIDNLFGDRGKTTLGMSNLDPTKVFATITIDRQFLKTASKIHIAKTILHECIHAYLDFKLKNNSSGFSLQQINNRNFVQTLNIIGTALPLNQIHHDFITEHMIPTMNTILLDIKDTLVTATQNNTLLNPALQEHTVFVPIGNPLTVSTTPIAWNWNDYCKYLSYQGLEGATSYPLIFPSNSNVNFIRDRYITVGDKILNP